MTVPARRGPPVDARFWVVVKIDPEINGGRGGVG
jgi:hypothetical protein